MFAAISRDHMQKGGIKKPLIIGLGVGIAVIVIVIILTTTFSGMFSEVKPAIEGFMAAGAANNTEAAYACCHQSVTEEDIAEFIGSNYDDLFADYERLNIDSYSGESSGGITTCDVSGDVIYTGDTSLPFEASLVKQSGVWKITSIQIGY